MKKISYCIIIILVMASVVFPQVRQMQRMGGSLTGKVIDAQTKEPIEYANIVVYSSQDSSQVTGNVSKPDGTFEVSPVRPGNYYVEVQFISFDKVRLNNISITPAKMSVDLGTIEIKLSAINLGNVIVEGERSAISYQIDKKVVDVDKMATTVSGNAADVLQNVPSVTVDVEGNVSLRGSTNFTVLIDGRPSVLDAQDALQQIPAGSISNIEIITNASAKYKAEGSAGIINIIMKKGRQQGLSGVSNLNAGWKDKYGGDFLAEYKTDDYSANFGFNYNDMVFPGSGRSESRTIFNGVTSYTNTTGNGSWGRNMWGFRGGLELFLSSSDVLSFSGRYGDRSMKRTDLSNYDRWSGIDGLHSLYGNSSKTNRGGIFYALNLNYQHKFPAQGHELSGEFSFHKHNSDESSLTESISNSVITSGIKTTENGPSNEIEGKIDYTLPFNEKSKFMAGYDGELELSDENTGYYTYNTNSFNYDFIPLFSHAVKFDEGQHAFYSIYSNQPGAFGYQVGIRAENTYRSVKVGDNPAFKLNDWDFFPSIHTSYSFSAADELMASYTRRISRPGGWNLEPFDTWMDANNIRRGNPELLPEYVDSYEGGFKTLIAGISLSTELYYRMTHNKIEDIKSAYAENVTLTTFGNVGSDYSVGSEIMINSGIGKFWDMNLMGNLYNYKIEGTLYNVPFSRESFNWNARLNNSFRVSEATSFQVNMFYNSPSVSSQGTREAFFSTDLAVRQEFLNKALALTLQVRDILSTAKFEYTSSGPDFYNYNYFTRQSPVVMLNLRYNINNFKQKPERPDNGGDFNGEGEGGM